MAYDNDLDVSEVLAVCTAELILEHIHWWVLWIRDMRGKTSVDFWLLEVTGTYLSVRNHCLIINNILSNKSEYGPKPGTSSPLYYVTMLNKKKMHRSDGLFIESTWGVVPLTYFDPPMMLCHRILAPPNETKTRRIKNILLHRWWFLFSGKKTTWKYHPCILGSFYPLVNKRNYGTSQFLMDKSTINGNFQ